MGSEFDVIVVGAGPAGASCARELVKKGHKVLLIEKSKEIGEPNFSSVGTPNYILEEFGLPQSVVGDYWDKFQAVLPSSEHIWEYGYPRGYVLKFNELKKFLVDDAAEHGGIDYIGTAVTEPLIENSKVVGVKFTGIEKGEARGKVVVDASGPHAVIASKVGLRPAVLPNLGVGLEYILTNVHFPKEHVLAFYIGQKWMPHGYAWIFPMGGDKAKVGLCGMTHAKQNTHEALIDILKDFMNKIPWLAGAEPLELHGSSIYLTGGINRHVSENVIVVGDAASQINPFGGEGVRHALRSGRMAAERIDEVLKTADMAKLLNYEEAWKHYIGKKWKLSYLFAQLVYIKLNDDQLDQMMSLWQELTSEELFDVVFEYKFENLLRMLPRMIGHMPLSLVNTIRQALS